jgi:hypothetical protein
MNRALLVCCIGILAPFAAAVSQGAPPDQPASDRFGLGVSGITGSIGGYNATFPGVEGFVRIAHGLYWTARVDGAYYVGPKFAHNDCIPSGGTGCVDNRYVGGLGTLMVTLTLGPAARGGLRPIYGLLGAGGAAAQWGGGTCSMDVSNCGPGVASGLGPTMALVEAGVGSEFHALGDNRIELRIHDASRSLLIGSSGEHHTAGGSLTLGFVW